MSISARSENDLQMGAGLARTVGRDIGRHQSHRWFEQDQAPIIGLIANCNGATCEPKEDEMKDSALRQDIIDELKFEPFTRSVPGVHQAEDHLTVA